MELRKDPITRSWVITGDDVAEPVVRPGPCPFCGDSAQLQVIATLPRLGDLADAVDAFCETIGFTTAQIDRLFEAVTLACAR